MHARIRSHYIDVALVESEANTSGNCFYEDFNCFVNVWLLGHDYMYHSMPCYNYNHRSSFNKSMNVSTSATKPTRLRRKSSMQHWRSYMNGPPLPLRAWSHLWHVCTRSVAASGLDPHCDTRDDERVQRPKSKGSQYCGRGIVHRNGLKWSHLWIEL